MKQTTCTYISVIMLTLFASSFVRIYQKLWELSGFPPWLNFCGHPVHVSYSINISGIPVRQLVPVYRTFLMTYRYEYRTCIPVSIPNYKPRPPSPLDFLVDAVDARSSLHFLIADVVLPFGLEYFSQTPSLKSSHPALNLLVSSPCLCPIQK